MRSCITAIVIFSLVFFGLSFFQYEPFADRTSENREIAAYQQGGVYLGMGTYSTTAHLSGTSIGFVF